jgi:hypothetical protein
VVLIANADHYIFLSNEADVLREMNALLPRPREPAEILVILSFG